MSINISSKYNLIGMDCPGCANTIEKYCIKITGISKAEVNYSSSSLKIECDSAEAKLKLETGIQSLGYTITEIGNANSQLHNDVLSVQKLKLDINEKLKNKFRKNNKIRVATEIIENNIGLELQKSPPDIFQKKNLKLQSEFKKTFSPIFIYTLIYLVCYITKYFDPKIGYLLFVIAALISLHPILKKLFQYFKVKFYFSVELLMTIAVVGALFIHSAQEAAMVMILFQLGEALEGYTSKKASKGIEKLSSLIPQTANLVLKNNFIKKINSSEIQKNQILLIKPGERFPADGVLIEGETYIDESLLTGEAIPVHRKLNEKIVAGSLNTLSAVKILTTQVGQEHAVARLIQLVQDAQGSKSKTLRTIENFSKYYTPFILAVSFITAIFPPLLGFGLWENWIYKGLALLLIGCPCALIISTPSAIAAGISTAAKFGILIKHAAALEILGKINLIAFDKTGTLTDGKLNVTDTISFSPEYTEDEILRLMASLETQSTHPLANSILNYSKIKNMEPYSVVDAKTISGVGISGKVKNHLALICSPLYAFENKLVPVVQIPQIEKLQNQGKTICILILENKAIGLIALQDKLKENVTLAIKQLKDLKISSIILTGDHKRTADAVAKTLDISILSQLLPEQKLAYIRKFSECGRVAMVGDGINDAPALAAADVGIAMGEGTDVAVDSAQIVIANKNILSLVSAIKIARKTSNLISQNIFIALFLKLLFLYLTFLGDTMLWMAILADTGATVLVTLNSMRLLSYKSS